MHHWQVHSGTLERWNACWNAGMLERWNAARMVLYTNAYNTANFRKGSNIVFFYSVFLSFYLRSIFIFSSLSQIHQHVIFYF
jgi:hypothetical protein